MHEITLAEQTLNIVLEYALQYKLTKVTKIHMVRGSLSGVMEDSFLFAFSCISCSTLASGATVVIEPMKALGTCNECKMEFELVHENKKCPTCKSVNVTYCSGYEFYIKSLEGEN